MVRLSAWKAKSVARIVYWVILIVKKIKLLRICSVATDTLALKLCFRALVICEVGLNEHLFVRNSSQMPLGCFFKTILLTSCEG